MNAQKNKLSMTSQFTFKNRNKYERSQKWTLTHSLQEVFLYSLHIFFYVTDPRHWILFSLYIVEWTMKRWRYPIKMNIDKKPTKTGEVSVHREIFRGDSSLWFCLATFSFRKNMSRFFSWIMNANELEASKILNN